MRWRRTLVVALLVMTGVSCQSANQRSRPTKMPVSVSVVDEAGKPVTTAVMTAIGNTKPINIPGTRELKIDQPVAGTIQAEGFVPEPFVIDPSDASVTVKLFSRIGPSGAQRLSFQFGGDVMMGRRYQDPVERSDTPIATTDAGAESVVRQVAPIMAAGVASTIAALDSAGIAWAGAGTTAEQAQAGRMIEVRGVKVGFVSATTVNGDFVNDSLPTADEVKKASVPQRDAWQYEERTFGFGKPGASSYMVEAKRRPGVAWSTFAELEPLLDADQSGALWTAMAKVYPELQDWVARRGHGGAAPFQAAVVAAAIKQLRADGADLVIVEIHGGFQFSDVASEFPGRAAHAAIDAGADLDVGHHPHVLQGFEWYKGHLIAYSLGNFVFDQDFLSTFPSVIMRTIFEGTRLIDARVIPLVIDRYQPVPVAGAAAARVIRLVNSRSALTAYSDRVEPCVIGSIIDSHLPGNAVISDTGMTGEITQTRDSTRVSYQLDDAGRAALPPCAVIRTGTFDGATGFDLLQWGDIDDNTADGENGGATQWTLTGNVISEVDEQNRYLRLAPTRVRGTSVRPVARSATPLHRWFDSKFNPIDGEPSYTLQLRTRGTGVVGAFLRVAAYDVDDTDPTTEPVSTLIHETEVNLPLHDSPDWRDVDVDLSSLINAKVGSVRPNAVLLHVIVPKGSPRLDIDDVRLMEWRDLRGVPDGIWLAADALRGSPRAEVTVEQSGCTAPTN